MSNNGGNIPEPIRVLAPVVLAFVVLLAAMAWAFGTLLERRQNPNISLATGPGAPERVVLERNPSGQYLAPGTINGRSVTFLVDTGADHVAVPAGLAENLGLQRGRRIPINTAGGSAVAYATRIQRIRIGGIELQDVRGSITPAMGGDAVLLGMTFLEHVDFTKKGDRLIIEPPDR